MLAPRSYSTAPSSLVAPRSSCASLERAARPIAGEDSRRRTSAREWLGGGGRRGRARRDEFRVARIVRCSEPSSEWSKLDRKLQPLSFQSLDKLAVRDGHRE